VSLLSVKMTAARRQKRTGNDGHASVRLAQAGVNDFSCGNRWHGCRQAVAGCNSV